MLKPGLNRTPFPPALRRALAGALCAVVLFASIGCLKEIMLLGYLIGGPPSVEPDFDVQTKKSMTDYGVTVAVVCFAPKNLKLIDEKIDVDLAKYVSFKLNENHIKVINPDRVHEWLDRHPDWETAAEIGEAFKTTYVIYIDMRDYSLYEKGSHMLHRGRAEMLVTVWEMDGNGEGEPIYNKEIKSIYPLAAPQSSYDVPYQKFRKKFVERLSKEIGWKFYERYNGDNINDAT